MFTQAPKTVKNNHDIVEQHNQTKTIEHNSVQEDLFPGLSLSKENILQMQKTIGNKAVIQLLKYHLQQQPTVPAMQRIVSEEDEISTLPDDSIQIAGNFENENNKGMPIREIPVVQRMVAVAKDALKGDFIESNSIKYALDRAGEPVGLLRDLDLSGIPDGGSLYIVAHGSKEESGIYSGKQILAFLLDKDTGLREDAKNITIVFTSCHAGEGVTDPEDDSIVAIVAKGIKDSGRKNISVSGARGLSLKSSATGDDFTVIDPNEEVGYMELQRMLIEQYKPDEKYRKWLDKHLHATAVEKAEKAFEFSQKFYIELVKQAEALNYTLPKQKAMSIIQIDGEGKLHYKEGNIAEVIARVPVTKTDITEDKDEDEDSGCSCGCFLTSACVRARGLPDNCSELTALRAFRDGWLSNLPEGPELIETYYRIAPRIVEAVEASDKPDNIWNYVYQVIIDCIKYINNQQPERALDLYRDMVVTLSR